MAIVEKTWTVETRGTGRPDYSPLVSISKPVVGVDQEEWSDLTLIEGLAARTIEERIIYTVPSGYKLNLGGLIVTCSASCIQKIIVYTPGSVAGDYRYDMRGDIDLGVLNSKSVAAGENVILYIYNNDSVARDFSIFLSGVLEQVGPSG